MPDRVRRARIREANVMESGVRGGFLLEISHTGDSVIEPVADEQKEVQLGAYDEKVEEVFDSFFTALEYCFHENDRPDLSLEMLLGLLAKFQLDLKQISLIRQISERQEDQSSKLA